MSAITSTNGISGSALYPPESFPEAFITPIVAAGGTKIAEYKNFDPLYIVLDRMVTAHGTNIDTFVSVDGKGEVLRMHGKAMMDYRNGEEQVYVPAKKNMTITQQTMAGAAETNIATRFNITARMPTVVDMARLGINYGDLLDLANSAKISDRISAGIVGGHIDLLGDEILNQFKIEDTQLITKTVTMPAIPAGGSLPIVPSLQPPTGYINTLLGVGVDAQTIRGLALLNDTFVRIQRYDQSQPQLIKLDCAAMPNATAGMVDRMMRMYVSTANGNGRMDIKLESITGLAAGFDVKVMWGVRKINYIDRFLYSNLIKTNDDGIIAKQAELNTAYKLQQSAQLGVQI